MTCQAQLCGGCLNDFRTIIVINVGGGVTRGGSEYKPTMITEKQDVHTEEPSTIATVAVKNGRGHTKDSCNLFLESRSLAVATSPLAALVRGSQVQFMWPQTDLTDYKNQISRLMHSCI